MTVIRTRETTRRVEERTSPRAASRLVLWAGVALGTAIAVLAEWDGLHPRVWLGLPAWLGYAAGFVIIWLTLVGLSVWAASLLRRHRRTITMRTARTGRQVHAHAARRWAGRGDGWRAPLFVTRRRGGEVAPGGSPGSGSGGPEPAAVPAATPAPEALPAPAPVTTAGAAAPAAGSQRGTRMTATTTRTAPAPWKGVTTSAADFEPASDAELLEWMSGEVAGMLGYGEAVADLHEHCVSAVRCDPAAMAALHDVADAAADCAEAMARAIDKFKQVYEGPREFAADGGVLPKDGDWLTGEDET